MTRALIIGISKGQVTETILVFDAVALGVAQRLGADMFVFDVNLDSHSMDIYRRDNWVCDGGPLLTATISPIGTWSVRFSWQHEMDILWQHGDILGAIVEKLVMYTGVAERQRTETYT